LEIYKLVPTLFSLYDMSLVHPEKDWELNNRWFVTQKGVDVKLEKRVA